MAAAPSIASSSHGVRRRVGAVPTAVMLLGAVLGIIGPVISAVIYWTQIKAWGVVLVGGLGADHVLVTSRSGDFEFGLTVQGLVILLVLLVVVVLVSLRTIAGTVAAIVAGLGLLAEVVAVIVRVDGSTTWVFWADLAARWGVAGVLLCLGGVVGLVSWSSSAAAPGQAPSFPAAAPPMM